MGISRWSAAFFIIMATVVQGPLLNAHALSHALEQTVGTSSETDESHVSASECDLCDAYQIQNSAMGVAGLQLSESIVITKTQIFPQVLCLRQSPSFFSARAPPEFVLI